MKVRSLFLILLLSTGCMRYQPRPDLAPAPGARVQLALREPQPVVLGPATVNGVVRVEGAVVGREGEEIRLAALGLKLANGVDYPANGEEVAIPAAWVRQMSERRLSVGRSLAATGAVVAFATLLQGAFNAEGGHGGGGGKPRAGQ